jgi:hypothetical protein
VATLDEAGTTLGDDCCAPWVLPDELHPVSAMAATPAVAPSTATRFPARRRTVLTFTVGFL